MSFSEFKSTLPDYHALWIGPPSHLDTSPQQIKGQDRNWVIALSKVIQNPFKFVCLEQYKKVFEEVFSEEKIKIITEQDILKKCEEDDFLKNYVPKIKEICETYLKRGTKRDLVSLKNLMSILLAYFGGVVGDTNIRPTTDKLFSIPAYQEFLIPYVNLSKGNGAYDIWMIFSPPRGEAIKHIVKSFLEKWDDVEKLKSTDESAWHSSQANVLMMEAIGQLMQTPPPIDYTWIAESAGEENISVFKMKNLPLQKIYQGTHKPKQTIGTLLVMLYKANSLEYKSLAWENCKEAVKYAFEKYLFADDDIHQKKKNRDAIDFFLTKMREDKLHTLENRILTLITQENSSGDLWEFLISKKKVLTDQYNVELRNFIGEMVDFIPQMEFVGEDYYMEYKAIISSSLLHKLKVMSELEEHVNKIISDPEYKLSSENQKLILEVLNSQGMPLETKLEKIRVFIMDLPQTSRHKLDSLLTSFFYAYTYLCGRGIGIDQDKLISHLKLIGDSSPFLFTQGDQTDPIKFLIKLREDEIIFPPEKENLDKGLLIKKP